MALRSRNSMRKNGKRVLVFTLFPLLSLRGESRVGLSYKAVCSWCTQLRNRSGTEGSEARRRHYRMMLVTILVNIRVPDTAKGSPCVNVYKPHSDSAFHVGNRGLVR